MVVQKNWPNVDASQQNPTEESTISWQFQQPQKLLQNRTGCVANMHNRPPITRQIAINTLAAMHRRFSLPGPVQPHSRPISEFRASANKSLDILRRTIQSSVTREIDQIIKKYLEKFFVPAVNNIRLNLGDESVSEDQIRSICRAMLDATRLLYAAPARPTPSPYENSDSESSNGADSRFIRQNNLQSPPYVKRKESDTDSDTSSVTKRKKIKQEDNTDSASSSPLPPANQRDPEKWNPARLTQETLFIMGSHAHKVLGLGNSRGRLYTKHSNLLRYPADSSDKEWIASHNLVNAVGGKTYIMVLEDIEELATSDMYRHSSLPMLGELTGFKIPFFMLQKIKAFVMKRALSGDTSSPNSPQPSTSMLNEDQKVKLESIKLEIDDSNNKMNDIKEMIEKQVEYSDDDCNTREDFDDIKVDGIKVEDIDDIKVEQMEDIDDIKVKVEDLDVDSIKVENIDDISIDNIKVEDIKLENDGTLSVCKETEDETNDLVNGLLDSDIEFLSRNLGNIESDTEARKTIEKLTGADPDTITLVGDEFDFGTTLNTHNFPERPSTKCITVASTTSGMVHSVPVAQLPPAALHYYSTAATTGAQLITGIPLNAKAGTFSTVMSQGTASIIGFGSRTTTATIIGTTTQYVNVTAKTFPTGNILHNAIVSRNFINRSNFTAVTSYSITSLRPMVHTSTPKLSTVVSSSNDFDTISTTKDMIDNACNSSVMLKKVLTLGGTGTAKSFMMHNTQKVLSTGFATGSTPPPNVTIVSSGGGSFNIPTIGNIVTPTTSTLSATHATLSALLASSENIQIPKNNHSKI